MTGCWNEGVVIEHAVFDLMMTLRMAVRSVRETLSGDERSYNDSEKVGAV